VIGSQTSSNAQRLVEVARIAGAEAELIDGESPLAEDMVSRHEVIGLTAGASTPDALVDATIEQLAALGHGEVVEVTVAREDVHFRLPREVASA
jgi:4-hydroxy-3-methylbut-2-en-1-yl diphosphate reductase